MKEEYPELDVVVVYENVSGSWSEFKCYEVTGHYADDNGKYTKNIYEKEGAKSSEDTTENIDEAQTLVRGVVKWDGCSHYTFGDEDGYIHLCGGSNVKNLSEIIKKIYNRCGELMRENGGLIIIEEEFPIK